MTMPTWTPAVQRKKQPTTTAPSRGGRATAAGSPVAGLAAGGAVRPALMLFTPTPPPRSPPGRGLLPLRSRIPPGHGVRQSTRSPVHRGARRSTGRYEMRRGASRRMLEGPSYLLGTGELREGGRDQEVHPRDQANRGGSDPR